MGTKKKCCQRYLRKTRACKDCPIVAPLPTKKARRKAVRKLRKKAGKR